MLWSGPRDVKPKSTAPVVTKAATASASVLTDTEPKVDESWLAGTNAQVSKKVKCCAIITQYLEFLKRSKLCEVNAV